MSAGAHVVLEERDDTGEDGVSVTHVIVNGVDLGRVGADLRIKVGTNGSPTTIKVTLIPSRLEIRGSLAEEDRQGSRVGFTAKNLPASVGPDAGRARPDHMCGRNQSRPTATN
ncbi:hypothetical protein AB0F11_32010 [Streptomyces sp. NPDC032472]|uniref:hypothetical protein n=1 Tax=Streptomyces sp. NPDC032472 TaxID=3155018 RepID=UPI0033D4ECE2